MIAMTLTTGLIDKRLALWGETSGWSFSHPVELKGLQRKKLFFQDLKARCSYSVEDYLLRKLTDFNVHETHHISEFSAAMTPRLVNKQSVLLFDKLWPQHRIWLMFLNWLIQILSKCVLLFDRAFESFCLSKTMFSLKTSILWAYWRDP